MASLFMKRQVAPAIGGGVQSRPSRQVVLRAATIIDGKKVKLERLRSDAFSMEHGYVRNFTTCPLHQMAEEIRKDISIEVDKLKKNYSLTPGLGKNIYEDSGEIVYRYSIVWTKECAQFWSIISVQLFDD